MRSGRTYLDWNATAPLRADVRASMLAALDVTGNPSSPHAEGRRARALIEDAREAVAALVGARPDGVVFTSGATEANNTVLAADWDTILLSPTEHDSVLAPARASAARLVEVPVDGDGRVCSERLAACLEELATQAKGARALFSLQIANNETGVLQPLSRLAGVARRHGLSVHSDAVQGVGRVPISIGALDVDYLSLSAHKIGGPKGIGALVLREGAPLRALLGGGGQERGRRAGTENVAAIAGFGAAASAAAAEVAEIDRVRRLRDALEREVRALAPEAVILGCGADRLANTSCLAVPGTRAETLVIALDLAGIAVSAGAACSSGKVGASHVLRAMGLSPEIAAAAIRVSLGPANTQRDIARFLAAWAHAALKCVHRLVA
jgi:cysteine desulfurase